MGRRSPPQPMTCSLYACGCLARPLAAAAAAALCALGGAACHRSGGSSEAPAKAQAPGVDILAEVNGVAITQAEVNAASAGMTHGSSAPASSQDALEGIVQQELAAQR